MILFGCLLAFSAAVAPRLVLILAWIFSDRWAKVWEGDFLLPILGIVFLPYTTIMYMLTVVVLPGGGTTPLSGWDWMWIILGLFLDFMKWSQMFANRKEAATQTQKYYPSGAPKTPTGTGSSSAAAASTPASTTPASTTPSAPAADSTPSSDSDASAGDSSSDDKGAST